MIRPFSPHHQRPTTNRAKYLQVSHFQGNDEHTYSRERRTVVAPLSLYGKIVQVRIIDWLYAITGVLQGCSRKQIYFRDFAGSCIHARDSWSRYIGSRWIRCPRPTNGRLAGWLGIDCLEVVLVALSTIPTGREGRKHSRDKGWFMNVFDEQRDDEKREAVSGHSRRINAAAFSRCTGTIMEKEFRKCDCTSRARSG